MKPIIYKEHNGFFGKLNIPIKFVKERNNFSTYWTNYGYGSNSFGKSFFSFDPYINLDKYDPTDEIVLGKDIVNLKLEFKKIAPKPNYTKSYHPNYYNKKFHFDQSEYHLKTNRDEIKKMVAHCFSFPIYHIYVMMSDGKLNGIQYKFMPTLIVATIDEEVEKIVRRKYSIKDLLEN